VAAAGNHESLRRDPGSIRHGQRLRIREPSGAAAVEQRDAGAFQVAGKLLLLVQLVDGALGGGQQRREVERRTPAA
jgi:hypothetical protein